MTITYHDDIIQRSDEWKQLRMGVLTASEMDKVLTPTLKIANNKDSKTHVFDIAAQRIARFVDADPYQSKDMVRGDMEEQVARDEYTEKWEPVRECGFVTNDEFGYLLGMSPDGLVGDDGMIEVKSRMHKWQVQTIVQFAALEIPTAPSEFMLQIQTGLLVTKRKWCDFISICTGLNMVRIRVHPQDEYFEAILKASKEFEQKVADAIGIYNKMIDQGDVIIQIPDRVITEMY